MAGPSLDGIKLPFEDSTIYLIEPPAGDDLAWSGVRLGGRLHAVARDRDGGVWTRGGNWHSQLGGRAPETCDHQGSDTTHPAP